jgi:hypothetical protein
LRTTRSSIGVSAVLGVIERKRRPSRVGSKGLRSSAFSTTRCGGPRRRTGSVCTGTAMMSPPRL